MLNYSLSSVIPTKSSSKGLITDTNLIFANNTFVFSFNDKPMLIGTVKSDILSIKNLQLNYLISTQNKIYLMNKKGEILHSFRKEVNFIETFGEKVYFVSKNILQIYSLGKDYRLNLENNIYIHSEDINFFKRIEDLFFTCSTDRSLKLFYKNNFMTIGKFRSKIINLFVINFDPFTLQIITEGGIRYQEVYCFDYFNKTFVKKEKNFENINNIFLPGKICAAVKKENCVYFVHTEEETKKLVLFENNKIKCEYEIQEEFYEMEIYKNEIILKNENGIKAFTNLDNTLIDKVDFPEVICMAEERNKVVLGCTDKFIRTYDDTFMFSKLKDEKSLGSFFSVHKIKNVIFSVTGSGYVSVFDLNNNVCFRSFHIECRVSGSALNEDGSLLFLSNFDTNEIYVIDVLRSKKVDTIDNGAPIIKMTMFKSFLYVLSTESIIKYDLYNSSHVSITFSGNSLTFGENLAACTDKSVYIFDTNLNITSILDCKLTGKNSSEKFNKNKPITKISFDHLGNILCSGCVNQIYMLNDKESKKYNVCFNETLENYKDFFTKKEKNKIFNEENLIETKELIHSQNSPTFYVLSKHALLIYKIKESKILFDSLDTQESAENLFAKKDFISALFLALKLNLTELTRNIVRKTIFLPNFNEELLEKLAKIVVRMIEENDSLDNSLVWLRNILKQIQLSDDDKNKIRIILEKLRFNGWMMFKKAYKENKKVINK